MMEGNPPSKPPEFHVFGSDLENFIEKQKNDGSIFALRGDNPRLDLTKIVPDGMLGSTDVLSNSRNTIHVPDSTNFSAAVREKPDKKTCQNTNCQKTDRESEFKLDATLDQVRPGASLATAIVHPIERFSNNQQVGGNLMSSAQEHSDNAICQKEILTPVLQSDPNLSTSNQKQVSNIQTKGVNMKTPSSLKLNASICYKTKRNSSNRRTEKIIVKKSKGQGGSINKLNFDMVSLGFNETQIQSGKSLVSDAVIDTVQIQNPSELKTVAAPKETTVTVEYQNSNVADPIAIFDNLVKSIQRGIEYPCY